MNDPFHAAAAPGGLTRRTALAAMTLAGVSAAGLARGRVPHPAQYHWSSYQYHGLGKPISCLTPHPLYLGLGENSESRCQAYHALFSTELSEVELNNIRQSLTHNYPLGGERFRAEIEHALGVRLGKCGPGRPGMERGRS